MKTGSCSKIGLVASVDISYRNQSLPNSVAGWAETKQGEKRSNSERKGTIYVQATLRKTAGSSLKAGNDAIAHDIIDPYILNESGPTASSTFSE